MKAKITSPNGFRVDTEDFGVVTFKQDDIVGGWVAETALAAGCAERVDDIAQSLEWKDRTLVVTPKFKRPSGRVRGVKT